MQNQRFAPCSAWRSHPFIHINESESLAILVEIRISYNSVLIEIDFLILFLIFFLMFVLFNTWHSDIHLNSVQFISWDGLNHANSGQIH